jgi:hypothetical protein
VQARASVNAPSAQRTPALLVSLRQHKAELQALVQNGEAREARREGPAQAAAPPEPLTQSYPCVVCGGTERWDDTGIWRCVACWPPEAMGKRRR